MIVTPEEQICEIKEQQQEANKQILLMSKDLHQLSLSVTSIASSMEVLVQVQQDQKIHEERNETRHRQVKEGIELLHSRVDVLKLEQNSIRTELDGTSNKGDIVYNFLVWAGKIIGGSLIITAMGLFYYLIDLKGAN